MFYVGTGVNWLYKSNRPTRSPMKKLLIIVVLYISIHFSAHSQGRVVINEFMPWTSNTCGGPTAEFVELLNFGPGPVNIGCYILTEGDFAITIPANTILQPGEFFVISGQDVIPGPCANIDSTIQADLNWNLCGCANGAIPTTGDGLFTDGGMASEQVVLLDPSLNVVDAVVRTFPVEPSSLITTNTLGSCGSRSFDLDLMTINYETIGESAGRGNSFARKLDGDCGWVKDPQQSANATNNTPSDVSDVDYDFAVSNTMSCGNNGSIEVAVNTSNPGAFFPVTYTLAYDTDQDHIFEMTDSYTQGVDNSPNVVNVGGLAAGDYRITVASALGCNLHTFPFAIVACGPLLPVNLVSFTASYSNNRVMTRWTIEDVEFLNKIVIEKSRDGSSFVVQDSMVPPASGSWNYGYGYDDNGEFRFVRIRLIQHSGAEIYSPIVNLGPGEATALKAWPNPATDQLSVQMSFDRAGMMSYSIRTLGNQPVISGQKLVYEGTNLMSVPVRSLPSGAYYLIIQMSDRRQVVNFLKL
jgi:hypothetical protein